MTDQLVVENPKRHVSKEKWSAGWYNYYAGFSPRFAKALLESSGLARESVVADPWNGSGTTTEIASVLGFRGYGFDVNPVMMIVAKARMLRRPTRSSIKPLTDQIIESARTHSQAVQNDPLAAWFRPKSVNVVRRFEVAIYKLLIDSKECKLLNDSERSNRVSDIAAFFYNALFRSVRSVIKEFLGSNPTWVRKAKSEEEKITVNWTHLGREFRRQVNRMLVALDDVQFCHIDADYLLETANSRSLPISDQFVDFILSSPPYCTRIDYAITTLPELAILGYSESEVRKLRDTMIGTSTISKNETSLNDEWGSTCKRLLKKIKQHESKASATYYYKNHLQYFDALYESLGECYRVLKPQSRCVLVVQDSYYKDVHNNLPKIVTEMANAQNLSLIKDIDFLQSRTLAGVNPNVRAYRDSFSATESVLCFKKC